MVCTTTSQNCEIINTYFVIFQIARIFQGVFIKQIKQIYLSNRYFEYFVIVETRERNIVFITALKIKWSTLPHFFSFLYWLITKIASSFQGVCLDGFLHLAKFINTRIKRIQAKERLQLNQGVKNIMVCTTTSQNCEILRPAK